MEHLLLTLNVTLSSHVSSRGCAGPLFSPFTKTSVRNRIRSASPTSRRAIERSISPQRGPGGKRPMSSYSVMQAAAYPRPAAFAVGVQPAAAPVDLGDGLSVLAFSPGVRTREGELFRLKDLIAKRHAQRTPSVPDCAQCKPLPPNLDAPSYI